MAFCWNFTQISIFNSFSNSKLCNYLKNTPQHQPPIKQKTIKEEDKTIKNQIDRKNLCISCKFVVIGMYLLTADLLLWKMLKNLYLCHSDGIKASS